MTPGRPPGPLSRARLARRNDTALVERLLAAGVDTPSAYVAAALDRLVPPGETTTSADNLTIAKECHRSSNIRKVQMALGELHEAGFIDRGEQVRGESHRVITLRWREEDEA